MEEAKAQSLFLIKSAADTAQELVNKAAVTVEKILAAAAEAGEGGREENTREVLADALREVFGENSVSGRFIDVSKIPLLCHSIVDINQTLAEIRLILKEQGKLFVTK